MVAMHHVRCRVACASYSTVRTASGAALGPCLHWSMSEGATATRSNVQCQPAFVATYVEASSTTSSDECAPRVGCHEGRARHAVPSDRDGAEVRKDRASAPDARRADRDQRKTACCNIVQHVVAQCSVAPRGAARPRQVSCATPPEALRLPPACPASETAKQQVWPGSAPPACASHEFATVVGPAVAFRMFELA